MSTVASHVDRQISIYSLALAALDFLRYFVIKRQWAHELRELHAELDQLDDRKLRDIGIERHSIEAMVNSGINSIALQSLQNGGC